MVGQRISAFGATALAALALDSMYYVYIIKSTLKNWYYVGHTSNVAKRLKQHNKGASKATKPYKPFIVIYKEEYASKGEAFKREQQIKRFRHGEAFKKLIEI